MPLAPLSMYDLISGLLKNSFTPSAKVFGFSILIPICFTFDNSIPISSDCFFKSAIAFVNTESSKPLIALISLEISAIFASNSVFVVTSFLKLSKTSCAFVCKASSISLFSIILFLIG